MKMNAIRHTFGCSIKRIAHRASTAPETAGAVPSRRTGSLGHTGSTYPASNKDETTGSGLVRLDSSDGRRQRSAGD